MWLNKYQWAAVAAALFIPSLLFARQSKPKQPSIPLQNLHAFLLMLQFAEGTYGPNAYRTLFGGGLFESFTQHPNRVKKKYGITSTAAGAYQFLYSTWKTLQAELGLPDFSPLSQNKAAIELIRKKGAITDVLSGKITDGIYKCRKIWASLPGAGYGQNERSIESLLAFYLQAGGTLNDKS